MTPSGMIPIQCQFFPIIDEQKFLLSVTVSDDEVKTALFSMGAFKA